MLVTGMEEMALPILELRPKPFAYKYSTKARQTPTAFDA
jgi:hypothetical protein